MTVPGRSGAALYFVGGLEPSFLVKGAKGIATRSDRTLLVAPGLTTRSKKLLKITRIRFN